MNSIFKIILIFLLSSLLILCVFVLITGITSKSFFGLEEAKLIKEEKISINDIENINVFLTSADIKVYTTDEEEITVKQYGSKDEKSNLFVSNEYGKNIDIKQNKKNFCFGFCFFNNSFELFIPTKYINNLTIKVVSANIELLNDFKLKDLNLKTTSGDIKIASYVVLENATFETVSGDIQLNNISSSKTITKTTSGYIEFGNIESNLNTSSVSGDIDIRSLTGFIELNTTSGEVDIDSFNIKEKSSIKTVSGDVDVILNNSICRVDTKTTSGNTNIHNSNPDGILLNIKTTSGDIEVK